MLLLLLLISPLLLKAPAQNQKISIPSVDCRSLHDFACDFYCNIHETDAELTFIETGSNLVELECLDGETRSGLSGIGKELLSCLKCIASDRPGSKETPQVKFWANICDVAWNQSIDKAVDMLQQSYTSYPGGYECGSDEGATATGFPTTLLSVSRVTGTLMNGGDLPTTTSSASSDTGYRYTGTPASAYLTDTASSTGRASSTNGVPGLVNGNDNSSVGLSDEQVGGTGGAAWRAGCGRDMAILAFFGGVIGILAIIN
ncbi:hypothetical protein I316_07395 [Kwoniella heveanensis BCC8398]|uniref:Uncharacterized protein n=1 Tax=Kwoniella heveanensis BCC8398 TaxID=1296120 RepID=A0A1B9GJ17_9TREE|nr:hypothetical protein I316_07395 [Kwoniella heveanensis BCC8398]